MAGGHPETQLGFAFPEGPPPPRPPRDAPSRGVRTSAAEPTHGALPSEALPAEALPEALPAETLPVAAPSERSALAVRPGARVRLPTGRSAMEARMRAALECPVELVITDNRRTMISTKRGVDRLTVRLHHMFLDAPTDVVEALLCYLAEQDARSSRRIGRYIEANKGRIQKPRRRTLLRPRGDTYDLTELLTEVLDTHLPEARETRPAITWGKRVPTKRRRRRRSIRLGTYTHDAHLIRIHRALDQPSVPRWFVSFVVFHEALHHVVPPVSSTSRVDYHPPAFRRRERLHPDYQRAVEWENAHLDALLGFRG
ncbi:MAG: hypothetical protein AB8I08_04830 [Sandaracinaceae bacterium]